MLDNQPCLPDDLQIVCVFERTKKRVIHSVSFPYAQLFVCLLYFRLVQPYNSIRITYGTAAFWDIFRYLGY